MKRLSMDEKKEIQVAVTQGDIRVIKKEVEAVAAKLNDVHHALIGSPLAKDGGMVQRLADCEQRIEWLEDDIVKIDQKRVKSETYIKIIWACSGVIGTAIFSYVMHLIFGK